MAEHALHEIVVNAVKAGDLEHLKQLVRHITPELCRGHSLLHVAAEHDHRHVATFLLQFMDPNVVNQDGYTPAHLAAMKGHTHVLRRLLNNPHLDADKRDPAGRTYLTWLCVPLFEAVRSSDKVKIQNLLCVGADPDLHAREVVGGALVRELRISTARQLAEALNLQQVVDMFDKHRASPASSGSCPANTSASQGTPLHQMPVGTLKLQMSPYPVPVFEGPGVYNQAHDASPGYVCLLNYDTFEGRLDLQLEGAEADANNFAAVFDNMGFSGHAHRSLTADQTRQELARLRDMEEVRQAGSLVVIVSSHGTCEPRQQFLTSDMELLDTHWVLDLFKDSHCPSLKNKPKLFIWDLCRGYYREEQVPRQGLNQGPRHCRRSSHARVDEPLRDALILSSSSGGFTSHSFTRDGTPFVKALCRTLESHANKKEFVELYKVFLGEYAKVAPNAVPMLTNIGFSKQFYLSPYVIDLPTC